MFEVLALVVTVVVVFSSVIGVAYLADKIENAFAYTLVAFLGGGVVVVVESAIATALFFN